MRIQSESPCFHLSLHYNKEIFAIYEKDQKSKYNIKKWKIAKTK